jgi:hypothetical protein
MKEPVLFALIIIAGSTMLIKTNKSNPNTRSRKRKRENKPIIIKCVGNGNCLFEAGGGATGNSAVKVRKKIVREMYKNRDYYEPFFTPRNKNTTLSRDRMDTQDKSYDHYLERMTQQNQWGGNMELVAASKVYKRPVVVYGPTPYDIIETIGYEYLSKEPIKVLYNGLNHYDRIQ